MNVYKNMNERVCHLLMILSALAMSEIETVHLNRPSGGSRGASTRTHGRRGSNFPVSNININVQGQPTYQTNNAPVGFRASMTFTPDSKTNRLNVTRRITPIISRRRPRLPNSLNPRRPSPRESLSSNNKGVRVFPIKTSRNATVTLPVRLSNIRSKIQRPQRQLPIRRRVTHSHGGSPISAMSVLRRLVPTLRNISRQRGTQRTLPLGRNRRIRNRNVKRRPPNNRVDRITAPIQNSQNNRNRNLLRSRQLVDNSKIKANPLPVKVVQKTSARLQRRPKQRKEAPKTNKENEKIQIETRLNDKRLKTSLHDVVTTPAPSPVVDTYNGTDMVIELNRTLNKYGLDVDGLINLLQNTQNQVKQPTPANQGMPPSWHDVKTYLGTTAPFKHVEQGSLPINTTPRDNPFKALSDVRREIQDIALFLEGGNSGKLNQTESIRPDPREPPNLESTGNHVMDEMINQLLFATMNGQTP